MIYCVLQRELICVSSSSRVVLSLLGRVSDFSYFPTSLVARFPRSKSRNPVESESSPQPHNAHVHRAAPEELRGAHEAPCAPAAQGTLRRLGRRGPRARALPAHRRADRRRAHSASARCAPARAAPARRASPLAGRHPRARARLPRRQPPAAHPAARARTATPARQRCLLVHFVSGARREPEYEYLRRRHRNLCTNDSL